MAGFIPQELMDWLSAVVKRLDIQIDAQRAMITEIKLLKLEIREMNSHFNAEIEKREGKRT